MRIKDDEPDKRYTGKYMENLVRKCKRGGKIGVFNWSYENENSNTIFNIIIKELNDKRKNPIFDIIEIYLKYLRESEDKFKKGNEKNLMIREVLKIEGQKKEKYINRILSELTIPKKLQKVNLTI